MDPMMNMPSDTHDDETQDVDMIKQVLQKIIDEMDQMEADRLSPGSMKPKVVEAHIEAHPMDEMANSDDEESDPSALPSLMDKASHADNEGTLPEDSENDVPPELASIIAEKKKKMLPH